MARFGMTEITGLEPLAADEPRWFCQMATLPLPPCDAAALKQRLYNEYRIEIPTTGWGEVPCLRVSVQGYNTRSDIERLLEAVRALLPTVITR
jgi:isopenicillin-N epimerase